MIIHNSKVDIMHHCWFDASEVEALRAIGFLPPNCQIPAPLAISADGMRATAKALGDHPLAEVLGVAASMSDAFFVILQGYEVGLNDIAEDLRKVNRHDLADRIRKVVEALALIKDETAS